MSAWLPLSEAADRLGLSRSATYRATRRGELKSRRVAGRLLVEVDPDEAGAETEPGTPLHSISAFPLGTVRNGTVKRCAIPAPRVTEVDVERARLLLDLERDELERRRKLARRAVALEESVAIASLLLRNAGVPVSEADAAALHDALALEVALRADDAPLTPMQVAETVRRTLAQGRAGEAVMPATAAEAGAVQTPVESRVPPSLLAAFLLMLMRGD